MQKTVWYLWQAVVRLILQCGRDTWAKMVPGIIQDQTAQGFKGTGNEGSWYKTIIMCPCYWIPTST